MAELLKIFTFGSAGVNVDLNPIQLGDQQLTKAQNAISDPLGKVGALTNRPGLTKHNASAAAGSVLGGIGVPLINLNASTTSGNRLFYLGMGAR